MPIEFRCNQCQKLLRTADETAGKSAKCPECGMIQTIPIPESPVSEAPPHEISVGPVPPAPMGTPDSISEGYSPFGASESPVPPVDNDNPYQSPAGFAMDAPQQGAVAIRPTTIDLGDVFRNTWQVFTSNLGMCIVAMLLVGLCQFGLYVFTQISQVLSQFGGAPLVFLTMFTTQIISSAVGIWLSLGLIMVLFQCARGQEVELGNLFQGGRYFWRTVGAAILVSLISSAATLVCVGIPAAIGVGCFAANLVIPGVIFCVIAAVALVVPCILWIMLSWYSFLIVDQDVGVMDSIRLSREIMAGNKGTVFVAFLVAYMLGMLFSVCTCFVGMVVFVPYMAVLGVVTYLMATGQQIGAGQYQPAGDPSLDSPGASPFDAAAPAGEW